MPRAIRQIPKPWQPACGLSVTPWCRRLPTNASKSNLLPRPSGLRASRRARARGARFFCNRAGPSAWPPDIMEWLILLLLLLLAIHEERKGRSVRSRSEVVPRRMNWRRPALRRPASPGNGRPEAPDQPLPPENTVQRSTNGSNPPDQPMS